MVAERLAAVAIGVGLVAVALGIAVLVMAGLAGGVPGLDLGSTGTVLAGLAACLLGFGLVIRGVHLNATLETLANVRLLQEETHRARTQAAVHSHAVREPMPELRPVAQMAKPAAVPAVAPAAPAERAKVVASATVSQMPVPAQRATAQTDRKASKAEPIKGKPFQPHPIFMARPPR